MPLLSVKLTDVSTEAPKMSIGLHELKSIKVDYDPGSVNPNGKDISPSINICWRDNETGEEDRARVYDKFWLNDDSLWRLKKMMSCAGLQTDVNEVNTDELLGIVVRGQVINNDYTDKNTGEVKSNTKVKDYVMPGL